MSKFIDLGNAGFASIRNTGFVDKSMLIDAVNGVLFSENRFMCITRARRFGKSETVFAGVYMTGILPIKRYNTQSALNNFEEYSMLSPANLSD